MSRQSYLLVCACNIFIATVVVQFPMSSVKKTNPDANLTESARHRVVESYGKLPLSFEANQGQADSSVRFLSRGNGYSLFLTSTEAVLTLKPSRDRKGAVRQHGLQKKPGPLASARGSVWFSAPSVESEDEEPEVGAVLRLKLAGANPTAQPAGLEELPGKNNYFIGNDPAKWQTNVPTYAKVKYGDVYPGIDLVYYGNQRQLEYDLVVAPGADPKAIRFDIQGAEKLEIDTQGNLVLHAADGQVDLHKPLVYQQRDGERREIPGEFVLLGKNAAGFQVAAYDRTKPLVIDPTLVYSTYLGGSLEDIGYGIAVDSSGNAYVAGRADSNNFPTATPLQGKNNGLSNAFVAKLNPGGTALLYSTFLGGSGTDRAYGLAIDSAGTAYVVGRTSSSNFPTSAPRQATLNGSVDAFVTRLNASGSALVFSTYLGGSGNDIGYGIAVDSSGNAYVTGATDSMNFPTVSNAFQTSLGGAFFNAFVTKLNSTGTTLVYSTYLGGAEGDQGFGIAADSSGNAYVTGITYSTAFPTVNPIRNVLGGGTCGTTPNTGPCPDAFVTKLNPTGSALVYSTYLGGNNGEQGAGIAVDSSGNAYVVGFTSSTTFPTTSNSIQSLYGGGSVDAFVSKLNPAGSALVYSTFLGGAGLDQGNGIAVDSSGNAYVTGLTGSTAFPTLNPFQQRRGSITAFVSKLNPAGSAMVYSTYLGGSAQDVGQAVAVDASGNVYVTGATDSNDFPTMTPVQSGLVGGTCGTAPNTFPCDDVFIVKITDANPVPVLSALSPTTTTAGGDAFNLGVTGSNFLNGSVVRWNGNNRTTTFTSSTRLAVLIQAADIATAGAGQVTVFNPAPGGGVSNSLTFTVTGSAPPPPNKPTLASGGTLNAASFAIGAPVAPGEIVTAFGTGLLPTPSSKIDVRMNGINALVFNFNNTQVSFQVPWEMAGQTQATLSVTVDGATSNAVTLSVAPSAPGIFTLNSSGSGQGAVLIASSNEIAAPSGSIPGLSVRPVKRGEYLTIYATGLGPVTNQPVSGAKSPSDPLSSTTTVPVVTIGGATVAAADVFFSGLAPGFVGLYQINVPVPANSSTGDAIPLSLSIGGVTSNTVSIAIQ